MLGKKIASSSSSKSRQGGSMPRTNSKSSNLGVTPVSPDVIAHIKAQDNFKLLPKYSSALGRPHDECLPADDLDAIQLELECMLSTVAQRSRALKYEYDSMDSREDKRKGKFMENKQPSSPGKRKREDKKFKDNAKYFGGQIKMAKIKNSAHSPAPSINTDDSLDAITSHRDTKNILPKNDIPNKFWLSVEPYCMPITQEDIKLLDDLIEEYTGPLVPPIPELGPHYSTQWATEDLKEEQDNSNPNAKSNKKFMSGSNTDVMNMIKKGEKLIGENVTGPLTQRLVAAFLEENVMQDDSIQQSENNDSSNAATATENSRAPSMPMIKNGVSIERLLKQELFEQGFLDKEDLDDDDEVLSEIERVRNELSAIAECNSTELHKLHAAAKKEMERLEIKRKLNYVDLQIEEMYKNVVRIKQERPLTEQEREEVFRLTEEQKRLSDQLDSMPTPGPSFNVEK